MKNTEFLLTLALGLILSVNYIIYAQNEGGDGGNANNSSDSTNSSAYDNSNNSSNSTDGSENIIETTTPGIDIYDPTSCPITAFTDQTEFTTCCENLDAKRRPFPECCKYPNIVVWAWQYNLCIKKIQAQGQTPQRCNVIPCCYEYMMVIDSTVAKTGIKPAGLKYSFLLSVNNNTLWVPEIDKSVDQCYTWLKEPIPNKRDTKAYTTFWDCYEKIPLYLYKIIECSYDFNFYYCPNGIFQADLDRCDLTKQYVYNCLIGGS